MNTSIVNAYCRGLGERDIEMASLDPDLLFRGFCETVRGRKAYLEVITKVLETGASVRITARLIDQDQAAVFWDLIWKDGRLSFCDHIQVENGRICQIVCYCVIPPAKPQGRQH